MLSASIRANESRFDGWGQTIAAASAQNSELLVQNWYIRLLTVK